ncbi:MAG TPA: peptide-methionine (S)-S-oxide reductase MsrA [Dongiaceae bacterium]|nr:peptide-methionine (S)-S-oxide reductase MsrA [Dongiaceae bacterium]
MAGIAVLVGLGGAVLMPQHVVAASLPDPVTDAPASGQQMVVLAGGCFWGMQSVFEHVKGVSKVTAGYAGGTPETADYETVSSGTTGHAESVQIYYDPAQTSFGQLLKVYFQVAHDPTELNRQGPDSGTQYRSAIFFSTPEQQQVAKAYIAQLDQAKSFEAPIVTEVTELNGFYAAESYHQHYADQHPGDLYIVINDAPKLQALQDQLPTLYVSSAQ